MGSGDTSVRGDFLASQQGPAFNLKVAIQNTDMPSMNDILRAYGSFDVAAGQFSVFSQVAVKDGNIDGYVKPMFANLKVYDYQKDKNTSRSASGQGTGDWRRVSSVQEFAAPNR